MDRITLRGILTATCLTMILTALPRASSATWPIDAATNLSVSTAPFDQNLPYAVPDGFGGVITVWEDARAGVLDIYAQRFDSHGTPLWGAGGVAVCTATGVQGQPKLSADGAGGAFVVWTDARVSSYDIYAQHLTSTGSVGWQADGVPIYTLGANQTTPQILALPSGDVVLAWSDYRAGNGDIYAQRLGPDGTKLWASVGVAICTVGNNQLDPQLVPDGANGVIVLWADMRNGWAQAYAQRVNAAGAPLWAPDGLSLGTPLTGMTNWAFVPDGAGGAVAAWRDLRVPSGDIYAQRIDGSGTLLWGPTGVAACTAIRTQYNVAITTDGAGGAIVSWADNRVTDAPQADIYAQRISAAGVPQWTTDGVALCTAPNLQEANQTAGYSHITSDGAGGAIVTWHDQRSGAFDIYAQRVSPSGAVLWMADGVALSVAAQDQRKPAIVSDEAGGAIVVWEDLRNGTWDIYSQQVRASGAVGSPPEPILLGVSDVPYDQGGFVQLEWIASNLDAAPAFAIENYSVWRRVPSAPSQAAVLPSGGAGILLAASARPAIRTAGTAGEAMYWEFVAMVPARRFPGYSLVAATTSDSLPGANPYTSFLVMAEAGATYYVSTPDSGYSVDNLSPAGPGPFQGQYMAGGIHLHWTRNKESDLAGYRLYAGTEENFDPTPKHLLASTTDTTYLHESAPGSYYKLTAVDVHGNESEASLLTPAQVTSVEASPLPGTIRFRAPAPNPSRGMVAFRVDLPARSRIRLAVFDVHGRSVRAMDASFLPAGPHELRWDGRSDHGEACGAGVYFARLEVDGRPAGTQPVTILR